MAQRKQPHNKPQVDYTDPVPQKSIAIDKVVLSSLALHASQERAESFYHETRKHVQRLGLSEDGKVFSQVAATGNYPTLLDVKRWLSCLQPKGKFHRQDRIFLKDFHATLKSRLPVDVLEKIEKEA